MPKHLQREIETLKKRLLVLVAEVETAVYHAALSIENRDAELARQVIDNDDKIDQAEVEVEEDCLKLLALYQPVAIDLRFIVAAMKINNDLERIGDLAVNIAERAEFLATQPKPDISFDFTAMAHIAQRMLKKCIDAFVELNTDMAQEVCATDDQIDAMNREMYLKGAGRNHQTSRPDSFPHPPALRLTPPRTYRRPRDEYRRGRPLYD